MVSLCSICRFNTITVVAALLLAVLWSPQTLSHDTPGSVSKDGRFTINDGDENFPPQPRRIENVRYFKPIKRTASQRQKLETPLDVALQSTTVQEALGARYAHVLSARLEQKDSEDSLDQYRLVFFSYSNNQQVIVTTAGRSVQSVKKAAASKDQPALAKSEHIESIELAKQYWLDRGNTLANNLESFAIQTYQANGAPYEKRVAYVSFHVQSPEPPLLANLVDLTNQVVMSGEQLTPSESDGSGTGSLESAPIKVGSINTGLIAILLGGLSVRVLARRRKSVVTTIQTDDFETRHSKNPMKYTLSLCGAVFVAFSIFTETVNAQTVIGEDTGRVEWGGWSFIYDTFDYADGLAIRRVTYNGKSILGRASFPVMSVFYDSDCGAFADMLVGAAQPVDWANNELLVAREFTLNGEQWFELGVRDFIGSYDIYQVWYFSENGALDGHVFSRGMQCDDHHIHYPMWRLDFDLDGSYGDRLKRYTGPESFEYMNSEFQASAASAFQHGWYVEDDVTGNQVRIDFDNGAWNVGGTVVPETSYSNNTISAMAYDGNELSWTGGASRDFRYIDNQSLINQDLVVWYRGYMPHSPEEGGELWHSTGVRITVINDQSDYDADGIPDVRDPDDDNDGVPDTSDDLPRNPTESVDTDADGAGNNADTDDDNDGVLDINDPFPLDSNRPINTVNNILRNGSFEDGQIGPGVAPTNWTISGTGGRHESTSRASDGTGYYAMDGWGSGRDGVISQTVTTVPGRTYTFSFQAAVNIGRASTASLRAEALNGSSALLSQVIRVSNRNTYSYMFTATGNSTTVRFSDVSTGGSYDIDLDAVSLTESTLTNIVRNGSFEAGPNGPRAAPAFWTISGTGGKSESATRSSDGIGYYAMDGWGASQDGVLSQTLSTVADQTYTLTFFAGKTGGSNVSVALSVEALDGSNAFLSQRPRVNSRDTYTYTFTARSNSTILRFSDVTWDTNTDYDIDIDDVQVIAN